MTGSAVLSASSARETSGIAGMEVHPCPFSSRLSLSNEDMLATKWSSRKHGELIVFGVRKVGQGDSELDAIHSVHHKLMTSAEAALSHILLIL